MPARRKKAPRAAPRLKAYNAKRDFSRTSEPRGTVGKAGRGRLRFVIQQHDARRMHYDFRLELDGVMKSWAVPKGPSLDPADKRLAVETEDHPIEYNRFEGNIPQGEYGGGAVIVWDRGTWTPEGDATEGLQKGHLSFSLHGEKTRGRYSLARMGGRAARGPKTNWLLIKRTDEYVKEGAAGQLAERLPGSVVSGRTVQEVGEGAPRRRAAARRPAPGKAATRRLAREQFQPVARKRARSKPKAGDAVLPPLADFELQLATLTDAPPAEAGYVYEIKLDGYRALAAVEAGAVHMRSRNGLDWSATFPRIAKALSALPGEAVLDGELCYVTPEGHTSFQDLQAVMPRGRPATVEDAHLAYYVFDLLWQDGEDLRELPLLERKARLQRLLGKSRSQALRYSEHVESDGRSALAQACTLKLEGLIAKRADAPYQGMRSRSWLKLKCGKRQEFVIVGLTKAEGSKTGFRSLLLGLHEKGGLRYAGKVGTGFTRQSIADIGRQLWPLAVDKAPVKNAPRERGVVWLRPELVAEVAFTEMTRDGALRHPSFLGLRQDKPADDVVEERPLPARNAKPAASGETTIAGVRITHPDRVMEQLHHTTKAGIARYYEQVAERLLPFAAQRPLALVRCPQGDVPAHACFFQKQAMAGLGKAVRRGRAAGQAALHIEDLRGLIELVQFNVVELHGWGARLPGAAKADWIVFDFDPDEALPFSHVVEAAFEMREALAAVDLPSFVKTTGGKGLHVVVPIRPAYGWDRVKSFAKRLADTMAAQRPDRYVATMSKAQRKNRIFVDYLRNGQGATAVLPYSVRARPGATVAVPLDWKELRRVDPKEFTVGSASNWLRKRKDPWRDIFANPAGLPDLR